MSNVRSGIWRLLVRFKLAGIALVPVAMTLLLLAGLKAAAAPGDLDPTWGTGGVASIPGGLYEGMAVADDGSLIVAVDQILRRFKSDGSLDPLFPLTGMSVTAVGQSTGGRFYAANAIDSRLVVTRFFSGGGIDPSFGVAGRAVMTNGAAFPAIPVKVAEVAGGSILVVATNPTNSVIAKLTPSGAADPAYGTGGLVTLPQTFFFAGPGVYPDGSVIYNSAYVITDPLKITRLGPNGLPDPGFGTGGTVFGAASSTLSLTFASTVTGIASLDGTFISGYLGPYSHPSPLANGGSLMPGLLIRTETQVLSATVYPKLYAIYPAMAALRPDGSTDSLYGQNGISYLSSSPIAEVVTYLTPTFTYTLRTGGMAPFEAFELPDLRRGIAGLTNPDGLVVTQTRTEIGLFQANGAVDTSFGSNGFVTQNILASFIFPVNVNQDARLTMGSFFSSSGVSTISFAKTVLGLAKTTSLPARSGSTEVVSATLEGQRKVSISFAGLSGNGRVTVSLTSGVTSTSQSAALGPDVRDAYDISAPGVTFQSAQVCLVVPSGVDRPRLLHYVNGQWVDITTAGAPTGQICGTTSSFSPFAVANARSQSIDFTSLPDRTFGDGPLVVTATASSDLPVTFSAGGSCTVAGSTVTLTAIGSCTITASQPGDATYAAATSVQRTFTIGTAPSPPVQPDPPGPAGPSMVYLPAVQVNKDQ